MTDLKTTCPYCSSELSEKKDLTKRSSFDCPGCKKKVYTEPDQFLYQSWCLDENQSAYVDYLWQLNHWAFAFGSKDHFMQMQQEIAERTDCDPTVGDVIYALMKKSLEELCRDQFERDSMKELMADYEHFAGINQ